MKRFPKTATPTDWRIGRSTSAWSRRRGSTCRRSSAMDVGERYRAIRDRIDAACARCGREPGEVRLVGACKRQPLERIVAAREAGLEILGENIVQEGLRHAEQLPPGVEWHLIGPLQSNKAKKAIDLFTTIESVDRPKIARVLDREASKAGQVIVGLVEVNLGGEDTKHGFSVADVEGGLAELAELEHLRIDGLMAIPPPAAEPEGSRPWFRRLRRLRDELFARPEWRDRNGLLSMGMSADFEIAVEEGATHVRVGSALFGRRES